MGSPATKRLYVRLGEGDVAIRQLLGCLPDRQKAESLRRLLVVGFCVDRGESDATNAASDTHRFCRVRFWADDPLDKAFLDHIRGITPRSRASKITHLARRGYAALYERHTAGMAVEGLAEATTATSTSPITSDQSAQNNNTLGFNDTSKTNKADASIAAEPPVQQPFHEKPKKKSAMIDLMG